MMYSGPTTTSPGLGAADPGSESSLQESISGRPGVPGCVATCGLLAGGWAGGAVADRAALGVPVAVQLARMAQVSAKVSVRNNG